MPTTAGIANARTLTACGNGVMVEGSQLNVPCAAGVCTVVQCPVSIPANYPTVSGIDVSAKWKDCTKLPLIDEPAPFCGSTVSTTHSLLAIAAIGPLPSSSSSSTVVTATPTSTAVSTTSSAILASTATTAPAKTVPPSRGAGATPAASVSISSAAASGTAASDASSLGPANDGDSNSGRTLAVIGGVIAGLLLLGVAGAIYWRYSRAKRLEKWNPDFGTLNNRPRPFSKPPMMGSAAAAGAGGAFGASSSSAGNALGAGAGAGAAAAALTYNHLRDDYPPQRYPSPEYGYPPTSSAAGFGGQQQAAYSHPNYAPLPPPPSQLGAQARYDGGAAAAAFGPAGFTSAGPQNINQIQQQGGDLTRYSTNKSMGLHVVNWEHRNTEPAPLRYPEP
ncbi:hypothetical protein HDU86_007993 [Geranomyces michiganensis]|nr:hypothetical protein HDU86_007993 [Geranomyces michiganensis]